MNRSRTHTPLALGIIALAFALSGDGARAQSAAPSTPVRATIAQAAWLVGDWRGTTGTTTFDELWTDGAGGTMVAVSRTLRDGKLLAFEFLRIAERNGSLVYIAQPGGRPPTDFTLAAITADSMTFENSAHDFPKVIRYARQADGSLEATTSDAGAKRQVFRFTRVR
jgi:hypothetical protein